MVFHCERKEEVESIVKQDPFIMEKYYQAYDINEFFEANKENNWLKEAAQTVGNIKQEKPDHNGPAAFYKNTK